MGLNIPQLPELTFEEDSHTYRLDGLIIPSVTTLMKPLSQAYYGGIDAKVLGQAADRGSAVHSAIDLYSKYGVIDIEPELEGYFEAFRAWAKDFEVKPYATETRTYNRSLLYAGTVDMSCSEKGVDTLADFKTTASFSPMLCGVQLEAYDRAQESHGVKYQNRVIIQLKKDGTYRRHTDFHPRAECWRVFTSLLNVSGFIAKYSNK